jgi:hypothetical protein
MAGMFIISESLMPWEIVSACVAGANTAETPAMCVCGPEGTGDYIGEIRGFPCIDCGQWGYFAVGPLTPGDISCCGMSGTVHEDP